MERREQKHNGKLLEYKASEKKMGSTVEMSSFTRSHARFSVDRSCWQKKRGENGEENAACYGNIGLFLQSKQLVTAEAAVFLEDYDGERQVRRETKKRVRLL